MLPTGMLVPSLLPGVSGAARATAEWRVCADSKTGCARCSSWLGRQDYSALRASPSGPALRAVILACATPRGVARIVLRLRRPLKLGWGARIRTWEWRDQSPLPYRLATPQEIFFDPRRRSPRVLTLRKQPRPGCPRPQESPVFSRYDNRVSIG